MQSGVALGGREPSQNASPQRRARQPANADIGQDRQAFDQIELLKDEANRGPLPADIGGDPPFALHQAASDMDGPGIPITGGETGNVTQQGGFAGTRGADQADHLARLDRQGNRLQRTPAVAKGLAKFVDPDR
jgi:hypothetical protein